MADEVKKVLGLDAVSLIKADLLNEIKQESELITREYREALENKANDILNNFETSSEADKQAILDQLTELGQKDETLAEGVESLRSAIQSLNNKVDNIDQPESVLSDNDVKKIITASLIQKSFWSNDSIGSPTVAGNEIVGLVGTFGKIKTENLEGTLIEGKTVQSIPDSEGNIAWQLNNAGNGHLANGNISWNENGDVTFGEGVKIKWDNVDEKPEIPEGGITESEKEEIITTVIDRSGITAETITGRTIQSSEPISEEDTDPTWQITNNGTGYLAKKNIVWDETGKLTANIDGGSLGKQDENGKFPFEWDEDNVYVNKNFVFDEGVGITWDNISGTENIASKDDIPNLDDYATKDYVDQNGGITEAQFTELGDTWIKTTDVTCDNLNVRKVETKSSAADRIEIKDNHLYCLNNSGDKNLIISSNALDTTYINKILATGITGSEDVSTAVLNNITLSSGGSYTDFPYRNSDIWVSSGTIDSPKPKELGYVLKGSTITCYMGVQACPTTASGYNSLQTQMLAASDWVITQGSAMTYVVGGGGATAPTSKAGGYVLLYKKNSSGQWEDYDQIQLTGNWIDAVKPYQSTTTGTARWKTKGTSGTKITIDEDGEYGLLLGLEAGSVYAKTSTAIRSLVGYIDVTVSQKAPSSYTEIGKDGIVVYDGKNILKLDSSGVEMKAKTSVGSDKFYGIKVTSSGFKLCKNGTSWVDWNPSYD